MFLEYYLARLTDPMIWLVRNVLDVLDLLVESNFVF